jgi:HAD superfamily hydrolase (TIGR01509 family)
MAIKAFIFDFDGLIVDTETPEFESWQAVFRNHGFDLPFSEWMKCLGTSKSEFDPAVYLEQLLGHPINKKKAEHNQRVIGLSRIAELPPLPGVETMIKTAHARGIKLAVASSSSSDWVWCNLARLGLLKYFDVICGGNEVAAVKPDPALYHMAMSELEIEPQEAIVFEDSPNGIRAAQKAGIFCVAIPNEISIQLGVDHADLVIKSMAEITIDELITIHSQRNERQV